MKHDFVTRKETLSSNLVCQKWLKNRLLFYQTRNTGFWWWNGSIIAPSQAGQVGYPLVDISEKMLEQAV